MDEWVNSYGLPSPGMECPAASCLNGYAGVVECCYVEDDTVDGCDFFAQRCKLGKQGVIRRCAPHLVLVTVYF